MFLLHNYEHNHAAKTALRILNAHIRAFIIIIATVKQNLKHNSPFLRVTPKGTILHFRNIMCQTPPLF